MPFKVKAFLTLFFVLRVVCIVNRLFADFVRTGFVLVRSDISHGLSSWVSSLAALQSTLEQI